MRKNTNAKRAEIATGLRVWARGMYTLEAAVELLIGFNHGRLLGDVWIYRDRDRYWFRPDEVPMTPSGLSGGEHRVLLIAASLADPDVVQVGLGDVVTGLDRDALALVMAAITYAAGFHQPSR